MSLLTGNAPNIKIVFGHYISSSRGKISIFWVGRGAGRPRIKYPALPGRGLAQELLKPGQARRLVSLNHLVEFSAVTNRPGQLGLAVVHVNYELHVTVCPGL